MSRALWQPGTRRIAPPRVNTIGKRIANAHQLAGGVGRKDEELDVHSLASWKPSCYTHIYVIIHGWWVLSWDACASGPTEQARSLLEVGGRDFYTDLGV